MAEHVKRALIISSCILMIPLLGNLYLTNFNWNFFDFIFAFSMLFAISFGTLYLSLKLKHSKWRIPIIFIVFLILILLWTELAVGLMGTPFAGI